MPKLSVILITHNESAHIIECLNSVHFADEWIVVDSGSTDDTIDLAQAWGAAVYVEKDWQGFGVQKNRALSYASNEWVLSIDADERVTPELAKAIQDILSEMPARQDAPVGYFIPRLSSFCGHFMRHGGWWPDHVLRLFKRTQGKFSDRKVHESVHVDGKTSYLKPYFLHYTYADMGVWLGKMNAYTTAGAEIMLQKGRSLPLAFVLFKGFWAFFRVYVLRLGFLDGRFGLIAAIASGHNTYYRCLKYWMLKNKG